VRVVGQVEITATPKPLFTQQKSGLQFLAAAFTLFLNTITELFS
jgi:hypothetical protein